MITILLRPRCNADRVGRGLCGYIERLINMRDFRFALSICEKSLVPREYCNWKLQSLGRRNLHNPIPPTLNTWFLSSNLRFSSKCLFGGSFPIPIPSPQRKNKPWWNLSRRSIHVEASRPFTSTLFSSRWSRNRFMLVTSRWRTWFALRSSILQFIDPRGRNRGQECASRLIRYIFQKKPPDWFSWLSFS